MLFHQGSPAQTNECGHPTKCCGCNFKLVCCRSPFCCIQDKCDLTPVLEVIGSLATGQEEGFSTISTHTDNIQTVINSNTTNQIATVNHNIDTLVAKLETCCEEMNSKLDEILSKLKPNEEVRFENGLVPLSVIDNGDPVLIEKKGIFGKTKWVEQK